VYLASPLSGQALAIGLNSLLGFSGFAQNQLTTKENQAMAQRYTLLRQLLHLLVDRHAFNRIEQARFRNKRQYRSRAASGQGTGRLGAGRGKRRRQSPGRPKTAYSPGTLACMPNRTKKIPKEAGDRHAMVLPIPAKVGLEGKELVPTIKRVKKS